MIASTGILECWSVVPISIFAKDASGKVPGQGAHGRGDSAYRGEVYTASGNGTATITRWTPNEVTVAVDGADPGDRLHLNQNWDPGWTANGLPAANQLDTPTAPLAGGRQTVVFRYTPVHLWPGILLLALTLLACALFARRAQRA
ncbi:MAG: hypothetical protein R3B70_30890 [Polyangiaceae bacterium]